MLAIPLCRSKDDGPAFLDGTSPPQSSPHHMPDHSFPPRPPSDLLRLLLVGGSDRGVLYGAARLADCGLCVEGNRVVLEAEEGLCVPAL